MNFMSTATTNDVTEVIARPVMRAEALALAREGFAVLPLYEIGPDGSCACGKPACSSPGKHPRLKHGVKEATKDPDIGLEAAGFSTAAANEVEHHACETLRQNKILGGIAEEEFDAWFDGQMKQRCYEKLSEVAMAQRRRHLRLAVGSQSSLRNATILEGDIRNVSSKAFLDASNAKVGELTLVAGGPPCQPFSRAGKRETVDVEDGRLFLEFVRVVRDTRPRWFLFENVKGLTQSRTLVPAVICSLCGARSIVPFSERERALTGVFKPTACRVCQSETTELVMQDVRGGSLEIILHEFEAIGYRCHYNVLNAADFGVPQNRQRLFIVGSRDHEEFFWPQQTHCLVSKDKLNEAASAQSAFRFNAPASLLPWRTVRDVLWKDGHPEFGKLDYDKAGRAGAFGFPRRSRTRAVRHLASPAFWRSYTSLPENIRALADKNDALLRENPRHPSLQLKKVGRFWSVRVGMLTLSAA